jgi:hypothetical protein
MQSDQPQTTGCSGARTPESSPVSSTSVQLTRGAEGGGCTAPPPSRSEMTDGAFLERAEALLKNSRDCGCAECVGMYHELIRSLMAANRNLLDQRAAP